MIIFVGLDEGRNINALSTFKTDKTPIELDNQAVEILADLDGFYISGDKLMYSVELSESKKLAEKEKKAKEEAEITLEYLKNKEVLDSLDDEAALMVVALYPKWQADISLKAGERIRHKDVLYRVLTAHITQETWTPDQAPSLFSKILIEDPTVIPEWEQPDSTNGYSIGDQVTHNGKTYKSLVDNNVWEPGVTGTETLWEEI